MASSSLYIGLGIDLEVMGPSCFAQVPGWHLLPHLLQPLCLSVEASEDAMLIVIRDTCFHPTKTPSLSLFITHVLYEPLNMTPFAIEISLQET